MLEDGAIAGSTADANRALGDLGKDSVAISLLEEGLDARIRLLERRDRIARLLFVGRIPAGNGDTDRAESQTRNDKTRNEFPHHDTSSNFAERSGDRMPPKTAANQQVASLEAVGYRSFGRRTTAT